MKSVLLRASLTRISSKNWSSWHGHGCDVAAFRPRANRESENLHYVGEHAEIGLMIAHHANTTEQQRARMVNVDI